MKQNILCAMMLVAALPLTAQTVQVNKDNRTIEVTATDSAKAFADVATLKVGFKVYAPDTQTAYAQATELSNAIVKALTDAGVDKKAFQSDDQAIRENPYNSSDKEWSNQHRYTVTQSWSVNINSNMNGIGKLLDVAVRAGANESGHIDWSMADDNALQAKAAAKALERAKAIAANMASGLGAKLGPLVYASNDAPMGVIFGYAGAFGTGDAAQLKAMPLAINAKEIEKTATVHAVFAIE